jgi:hypothetical protein
MLAEVDGSAGEAVVASLGDLGRHIVEYASATSTPARTYPCATVSLQPPRCSPPRAVASHSSTCTCTPPETSA